ncbi:ArnT family glycosyltransferase [Pedobacter endophyticus]|uniref:Glycosyltransferase family 39 protein n=1 Tax=Pedobacter endophyticus TaxID=2789740 RepID=A0A7S9L1J4_9SPHI|nr:glycosyltransferase family 39 protein [Pedobacter endophyticus]QPH40802.1 glycosyltransferase family 39 protein [Pedobacter endophyticus]
MHKRLNLPLAFGILALALFWQLGSWGVLESSEARYAEIAREMLETGNWLKPQYLQIQHFDKPLLTYWVTAVGLKLFGANAFGARFFLQIVFLLQIFLVGKITFELFNNKKTAIYAAIIYAGIPLALISIRNLTTDAYLNTFSLLSVLSYLLYYKKGSLTWFYLFFAFLGLAVFTKGPFALLLPLLSIFPIHQIIAKKSIGISKLHYLFGVLLTLLVGAWWFSYLIGSSPKFYDFLIGDQLINRVANADAMKRSKPFWYYAALLPIFVLPMFTLFISALYRVFKQASKPLKWLVIFTLFIPLLLFSASSSKLILYILPIIPFVAIISAHHLAQLDENKTQLHLVFSTVIYSLITLALIATFINLIPGISYQPGIVQLFLLLLLVAYGMYITVKVETKASKLLATFLILPLFVLPISTDIMAKNEAKINGTGPVCEFITNHKLQNSHILVWDQALNSVSFNLEKPIYSIKYNDYSLFRKTQFEHNDEWKKFLIDVQAPNEEAYLKRLAKTPSVLIIKTKHPVPAPYTWLTDHFSKHEVMGPWTIYYN